MVSIWVLYFTHHTTIIFQIVMDFHWLMLEIAFHDDRLVWSFPKYIWRSSKWKFLICYLSVPTQGGKYYDLLVFNYSVSFWKYWLRWYISLWGHGSWQIFTGFIATLLLIKFQWDRLGWVSLKASITTRKW